MQFCYDYNADRYCEKCGLEIIKQIHKTDIFKWAIDLEKELTMEELVEKLELTDSNNYPQKNHINDIDPGAPDHCGNCHVFLEHSLNEECENYVLETVYCDLSMYGEIGPIVQQWIDFWKIDINQDSDIKELLAQK